VGAPGKQARAKPNVQGAVVAAPLEPVPIDDILRVGQALRHPVKVALIDRLRTGSTTSPARFAGHDRSYVSTAAYHARSLRKLGVLTISTVRPIRGSEEHFHALDGPLAGHVRALLGALKGQLIVVDVEGETTVFNLEDWQVIRVARAIAHPMRLAIIRDLRAGDEVCSPSIWAERHGEKLGNTSYHFKALAKLGVSSMCGTRRRRGAIEHLYEMKGPLATAVLAALDILEGRLDVLDPSDGEI
jgi:hypothetical protein